MDAARAGAGLIDAGYGLDPALGGPAAQDGGRQQAAQVAQRDGRGTAGGERLQERVDERDERVPAQGVNRPGFSGGPRS